MTKKPSASALNAMKAAAMAREIDEDEDVLTTNLQTSLAFPNLANDPGERDGRSLRATGRTHQFATRITPELHKVMKRIVYRDEITLGELLERAVAAYEREKAKS